MPNLIKKTTYPRSISLTQSEFDELSEMKYDKIEARSMVGKLVRELPVQVYSRLLTRAKIQLVNDDPNQKHYWVLNF